MTGNICVYCPGGPDSDFEYSTQSYTGYEPTSMRAIRARYHPFLQTRHRVEQLQQLGHSVDKVEFIIMGGTFMCLSEEYRDYFIRNLHDALSGHSSSSVTEAVKYSEKSRTKCIGITIETRPDYCLKRHISDMLSYGRFNNFFMETIWDGVSKIFINFEGVLKKSICLFFFRMYSFGGGCAISLRRCCSGYESWPYCSGGL